MVQDLLFDSEQSGAPHGVVLPPPSGMWRLRRWAPDRGLSPFVSWLWLVEWDLVERYETLTLPHIAAMLVSDGQQSQEPINIIGPKTRRFSRTLDGSDWVIGARFTAAGLRGFTSESMRLFVDQTIDAQNVFPTVGNARHRLRRLHPDREAANILESCIAETVTGPLDHRIEEVNGLVAELEQDRSMVTVDNAVEAFGGSRRTLQRLFTDYVGVGVKTVIRRFRLQELAAMAMTDSNLDWVDVAQQLGYSDQAHLVRDFTSVIGQSPTSYGKAIRET